MAPIQIEGTLLLIALFWQSCARDEKSSLRMHALSNDKPDAPKDLVTYLVWFVRRRRSSPVYLIREDFAALACSRRLRA